MSHQAPGGGGEGIAGGVAGAHFPSGVGVEGVLPFTGSLFTLPLAILGALLTAAGWVVLRLSRD